MTTIEQRLAHLERPISPAGLWCHRLAVFAIPYFAIVIAGHRFGAVETMPALWMLGLGVLILILSLILGVRGFYDLWTFGHKAGLNAARGMFLAALMLMPFVYQGTKAIMLPPLADVSTDLEDVPAYDTVVDVRSETMNSTDEPGEEQKRLQLTAYPQVAARRYPLGEARVFREIIALIGERDWTILTSNIEQGQAPIEQEGSGLVARPERDSEGLPLRPAVPSFRPRRVATNTEAQPEPIESEQISPVGRSAAVADDEEERFVEAVATSFLFGFPSDIVIRLVEVEDGTLVDMRSSSRWGPHDLGANAAIVLAFLADLDTALQGLGEGR